MSQTRDPNSTYCRRCGAELVWEHPKGSGHYQMSSDYVGGDICRSCLEEQRSMPTGAAQVMDEDVTKISVTLYQAPFAVLSERGLLLKMHDHNRPYAGPVPSQYYMPGLSWEPGVPWASATRSHCPQSQHSGKLLRPI